MILFPSAVDYIRVMNTNAVDNLLAAQPSYVKLPSLYQRAYVLVHETGCVRGEARFAAPREKAAEPKVAIVSDPRVIR